MEKLKKINRRAKVFISLMLVLILLFSISFTYAWFTDQEEMKSSMNFGKIALKITDDDGNKITTKTISFDVDRSYIAYQTGGKIMPGDKVSFKLNVGLESDSNCAYYLVKLKDSLNLFENSMYFADGTKDSNGNLIVYQTDGINTWVMGDSTKAPVPKYVGKISNTDTHGIKIETLIDEAMGDESQATATTVNCEILAIQQAHLSEQQARPMLIDLVQTGYSQVEYVKVENDDASNLNSFNTGVSWSEVGSIDLAMQFTSVPPIKPMIFSTYSSDSSRTSPYIYADDSGICFADITGTASENYTKTELTNNGQKSFRISGLDSTNTGEICFGSWSDRFWSASWECYSIVMYDKSGKVIRNFIPSVRTEDGTAGFYDAVNKTFHTNLGTNKFVAGAYMMSGEYTRVSYLQSSGKEYIDTGITPVVNLGFDMTVQVLNKDLDQRFLGSYYNGVFLGTLSGKWRYGESCNHNDITVTTDVTKIKLRGDTWSFNGTDAPRQEAAKQNNYNIMVFGAYYYPTKKVYCGAAKVYALKIYDADSKLLRDFVPCYRNIDNEPGLYDLVSGEFFTNAGSGEFVYA